MTLVGQQSTYQKGDVIPYKGGFATVVDTQQKGFLTIEFNGQQLSIKIDSLSSTSCWNINARIEAAQSEIAAREAMQDGNLEAFSLARKAQAFFKSKMKKVLGGADESELSGKKQVEYTQYSTEYKVAKKDQRTACSDIIRTSHALASMYINLGDLEQFSIYMNNSHSV